MPPSRIRPSPWAASPALLVVVVFVNVVVVVLAGTGALLASAAPASASVFSRLGPGGGQQIAAAASSTARRKTTKRKVKRRPSPAAGAASTATGTTTARTRIRAPASKGRRQGREEQEEGRKKERIAALRERVAGRAARLRSSRDDGTSPPPPAPPASASAATAAPEPSSSGGLLSGGSRTMPTLFTGPTTDGHRSEDLDRYAAALAAAEGLRRARDASVRSGLVRKRLAREDGGGGGTGGKGGAPGSSSGPASGRVPRPRGWSAEDEAEYRACRGRYAAGVAQMVRTCGLTVGRFNSLGKAVGSDPVLRERVMEQAYLYGMAAGLTGMEPAARRGGRPGGPMGSAGSGGTTAGPSSGGGPPQQIRGGFPNSTHGAHAPLASPSERARLDLFARAVTEVEALRTRNLAKIKSNLGVPVLPRGMLGEESVRSLLDPRVRDVVDAFPLQAEELVRRCGMGSDEFNSLLDRARCDPVYRWRLRRAMARRDGPAVS